MAASRDDQKSFEATPPPQEVLNVSMLGLAPAPAAWAFQVAFVIYQLKRPDPD